MILIKYRLFYFGRSAMARCAIRLPAAGYGATRHTPSDIFLFSGCVPYSPRPFLNRLSIHHKSFFCVQYNDFAHQI